jgi:hypothetical protein
LTQTQRYRVLESHPGFEIREYEPHTTVSVFMTGDFGSSSYNAFGFLAGFIGGRNQAGRQIAMTAPVLQTQQGDGYWVSFVMPDNEPDPPAPNDPNLRLEKHPAMKLAAIQFSGMAKHEVFLKQQNKLKDLAGAAGFSVVGEPRYARYNGPWTPPMLRRNEVLLPVA